MKTNRTTPAESACLASWILPLLVLLAAGPSAFGQGAISRQNLGDGAGGTSVNAPIGNADGTLLAGSGFSFQFCFAATVNGPFTALGGPGPFLSGAFAGYFNESAITIPGFGRGTTPALLVRAWDNAGGAITNYSNAVVRGQSAPFISPPLGDPVSPFEIPVPQGLLSFRLTNRAFPPLAVSRGSNGLLLTIPTAAGQNYRLEWSANLTAWNFLTNFTGTSVLFQYVDQAIAITNRRFYRVMELP
ncbi:MAG: hypothetical protein HY301_18020 [Verrucomicrobia bacterium]|nr:hypothetical protein [Verrucomicrobiota bacterium]